jgi:long-chain acyl-CoA synthetase
MSCPKLTGQAAAVTAALAALDVQPDDRVLIILPDGPGFAEAFAGAIQHGAMPLPANPLLPAHDIVTVAAEAGALG